MHSLRRFLGGRAEEIDFDALSVRASLAALAARNLVWDVNGPERHPLAFEQVLGGVLRAATELPLLTVVLDHCGGAVGPAAFGDAAPTPDQCARRREWEQGMEALSRLPNVTCAG